MLKSGFKTWAENTALNARRRLSLKSTDPIDIERLASYLGAQVILPKDIAGLDKKSLKILLEKHPESWSALTIKVGKQVVIVINSAHTPARQRSNLAHELAHILLGHGGSKIGISADGLLIAAHDKQQEEEANWLAGCLLLPREACLHIKKRGSNDTANTREYGVSPEMLKYRLNASGAERHMRELAGGKK